jgi:hypothetical protein
MQYFTIMLTMDRMFAMPPGGTRQDDDSRARLPSSSWWWSQLVLRVACIRPLDGCSAPVLGWREFGMCGLIVQKVPGVWYATVSLQEDCALMVAGDRSVLVIFGAFGWSAALKCDMLGFLKEHPIVGLFVVVDVIGHC